MAKAKAQLNAFQGKRIRQNITKLKAIKKRDRRLRKFGLSVMAFTHPFPWASYWENRKEARAIEAKK